MVLGDDGGKFKTRSGDTVRLRDLLDEGVARAKASLEAAKARRVEDVGVNPGAAAYAGADAATAAADGQHVAETVAYACIRYSDLCRSRIFDYKFSYDEMLKDKGNTAVYLLYMYARICAIFRRPEVATIDLTKARISSPITLVEEKERALALVLSRFVEVIDKVLLDLFPNSVCEYVYELATAFSEFYDACKVVENGAANVSRLLLIDATRQMFKSCFGILGITPLERM